MPTDEEYLAAVKSGDLDSAQKMVDSAAKKAGYNIGPVYHGTIEKFTKFDNKKTGKNDLGLWGRGHYFTSNKDTSKSYALRQGDDISIIKAYIKIKNPLILKVGDDLIIRMPDGSNTKDWVGYNLDGSKIKSYAQENGHDGVVQLKRNGEIGDLVAYHPNQIKSADPVTYNDQGNIIPLSRRFNDSTDDIRESAIPSFKNYFSSFLSSF